LQQPIWDLLSILAVAAVSRFPVLRFPSPADAVRLLQCVVTYIAHRSSMKSRAGGGGGGGTQQRVGHGAVIHQDSDQLLPSSALIATIARRDSVPPTTAIHLSASFL